MKFLLFLLFTTITTYSFGQCTGPCPEQQQQAPIVQMQGFSGPIVAGKVYKGIGYLEAPPTTFTKNMYILVWVGGQKYSIPGNIPDWGTPNDWNGLFWNSEASNLESTTDPTGTIKGFRYKIPKPLPIELRADPETGQLSARMNLR